MKDSKRTALVLFVAVWVAVAGFSWISYREDPLIARGSATTKHNLEPKHPDKDDGHDHPQDHHHDHDDGHDH